MPPTCPAAPNPPPPPPPAETPVSASLLRHCCLTAALLLSCGSDPHESSKAAGSHQLASSLGATPRCCWVGKGHKSLALNRLRSIGPGGLCGTYGLRSPDGTIQTTPAGSRWPQVHRFALQTAQNLDGAGGHSTTCTASLPPRTVHCSRYSSNHPMHRKRLIASHLTTPARIPLGETCNETWAKGWGWGGVRDRASARSIAAPPHAPSKTDLS